MDKIKKYIKRFFAAHRQDTRYELSMGDIKHGIMVVCNATNANAAYNAVVTFFDYGYAKGYRAAMAEMKKAGAVHD